MRSMKLKKLTLDNYGLYRGTITFDLEPRNVNGTLRPVVLFGGQNGAGKTTLFDAFRIVLYGKSSLGERTSESEYKRFMRNRIHRSSEDILQARSSYIELEFEYVPYGEPVTYIVRRAWELGNGKSVTEHLSVKYDEEPMKVVSSEYWQGLIEEIIPERLSSLFFFDGEKIKSIADDGTDNMALAESIKTLLGLDVVERLCSDLNIYKTREAEKFASKVQKTEINQLEQTLKINEERIIQLTEKLGSNQTQLDQVGGEIRHAELRLKQEGYAFALERETLVARKAEISNSIHATRLAIGSEYEGVYPFSLCPTLAQSLCEQIEAEQKQHKSWLLTDELKALEGLLVAAISEKISAHAKLKSIVLQAVHAVISSRTSAMSPPLGHQDIHRLSELDATQVLYYLDTAETQAKPKVAELHCVADRLTLELQQVERELFKVPGDSVLEPLVEDLNRLNGRKGGLEQERLRLTEELRIAGSKLNEAKRKREKSVAQFKASADVVNRIEQASNVQVAVMEYARKLTESKVEELRTTVAKCFNNINRKGDRIKSINIDPESFAVTLHDRFNKVLHKEELSAGEKQMYAVAMLWGLSITSGRPLPVIFDTPLGSLDSVHRRNLVNNYFPKAADQVLILSTDTEIDHKWYEELLPSISHSYLLKSLPDENRTIVSNGYFWRS